MSAALAPTVDDVVGHTEHGGGRRTRVAVILAALVIGTLVSVALGVWHPAPDGTHDGSSYDQVAGMRDAWWAWHVFGSIGAAVSAIAGSLVVVLLVLSAAPPGPPRVRSPHPSAHWRSWPAPRRRACCTRTRPIPAPADRGRALVRRLRQPRSRPGGRRDRPRVHPDDARHAAAGRGALASRHGAAAARRHQPRRRRGAVRRPGGDRWDRARRGAARHRLAALAPSSPSPDNPVPTT